MKRLLSLLALFVLAALAVAATTSFTLTTKGTSATAAATFIPLPSATATIASLPDPNTYGPARVEMYDSAYSSPWLDPLRESMDFMGGVQATPGGNFRRGQRGTVASPKFPTVTYKMLYTYEQNTITLTPTKTATNTKTATATRTSTLTASNTFTRTSTPTETSTETPAGTSTATSTPTYFTGIYGMVGPRILDAEWVVNPGGLSVTMAENVTSKQFEQPIPYLEDNQTIMGFDVLGRFNSGGNAVTLIATLFRYSAGSPTPYSPPVTIVASTDTNLGPSNARVNLSYPRAILSSDGRGYFIVFTGTTGASTSIEVWGIHINRWRDPYPTATP